MRNSNHCITKVLLAILFTILIISAASSAVTAAGNCDDAAIRCNDNNACTTDTCDEGTGACGHTTIVCNDNNNCTVDTCNPATGCVFTAKNCDDNNICTTDVCVPIIPTGCVNYPNTLSCNDNNACTLNDVCSNSVCTGTPKNCNDNDACTTDSCDTVSGNCLRTQMCTCTGQLDGTPCSDLNACTVNDTCSGGVCVPGSPRVCNDNNVCTTDTCNTSNGCVFTNNTGPCSDNNSCTDGDYCLNGVCQTGVLRNCDDGNVCTNDAYVPVITQCCVHWANTLPCNDNSACTSNDKCNNQTCTGTAKVCEDYDSCTTNSCDQASGNCVYPPVPDCICTGKSDGSPCTDGNACTNDTCINQVCVGTTRTCNDNNVCTTDTCNTATGCVFTNNTLSCSDNNYCTVGDVCLNGVCKPGATMSCDDGNICTIDTSVPFLPACCVHGANTLACDDNNACTIGDVCKNKVCTGTPVADGTACNDSNACTENDACSGGVCAGASLVCPVGVCDAASGCPIAYTITASADSNGMISPSGIVSVISGATTTFTMTPNTGYHVSDVLVDGVSKGTITSYPFYNVTANHTITASFAADDTTPPVVTITSPVAGNTNNTTPTLTYTVSDGTVVVKVDGVVVNKVSGNNLDILSFAAHTVRVESTDAANNTGYAEVTFTVVDPSLVGLWHMDGDWTNASGNGNNGTAYNGVTFSTSARVGSQAGSFDGVNDYVTAGSGIVSNVSNTFTIAFWVNPTASRNVTSENNSDASGISGQRYAVAPQSGGYTDAGAGVSVGNNGISVFEHGSSYFGYLPSLLVYNTTLSGWNHVAVVYQNRQPRLYVNGQFVRAGLTGQRANVHPSTLFGNVSTYGPYQGLLDEVAIYSRALSEQEIINLYTAPVVQIISPAGITNNTPLLNYTIVNGTVTGVKVDGNIVSKVSGDTLDILSDGTHTVRVAAVSSSGIVGFAEKTFTVDSTSLAISNVGISSNTINTGLSESSTIFFMLNAPATATLNIISEKQGPTGTPIYQSSKNCLAAGAYFFMWDGKDNNGKVVPDEAYLYILVASNGTNTDTYSPPSPTGSGTVTCAQSTGFDPSKNFPMTITYTPAQPSRVNINISWASQNFKIRDAVPATPASYSFDWDGRNPGNKLLDIGAQAHCSVASLLRENYIITSGDTVQITELKTDPYAMQLAYGQFTHISYTLSRQANVTVKLTSPSGTCITLLSNQLQSAGPQVLDAWNGLDTSDATGKKMLVTEEGDYMVSVQAVNPATGSSSISRCNLRVGF